MQKDKVRNSKHRGLIASFACHARFYFFLIASNIYTYAFHQDEKNSADVESLYSSVNCIFGPCLF
jgi:hypothetical protein